MIDGAKQEVKEGNFVIYSAHKSGQLDLGFVVGMTAKKVKVRKQHTYSWEKDECIHKTPERIVQVDDKVAKSMGEDFFKEMKGVK